MSQVEAVEGCGKRLQAPGVRESGHYVRTPEHRLVGGGVAPCSFAPSGLPLRATFHPRLAPWAVFFRRFAALELRVRLASETES